MLLDSMHPEQFERFEANAIVVPTEPTRAVIYSGREVLAYGIPEPYRELAYELASGDKVRSYMFNELRTIALSMESLRDFAPPGRPARVVVHGNGQWDKIYPDGRMERVWLELQRDLAARVGAPAGSPRMGVRRRKASGSHVFCRMRRVSPRPRRGEGPPRRQTSPHEPFGRRAPG